jgi:hypothetical protein
MLVKPSSTSHSPTPPRTPPAEGFYTQPKGSGNGRSETRLGEAEIKWTRGIIKRVA